MTTPWLTAAELAALGLADWPASEFRSRAKLTKLQVPSRLRPGSTGGGGREYDSAALPPNIRRQLLARQLQQALPAPAPAPAPVVPAAAAPAGKPASRMQQACADARAQLVQQLRTMAADMGMTRASATLAQQLQTAEAEAGILAAAAVAHQRPRDGDGLGVDLSARTLLRWHSLHRDGGWAALLPQPSNPSRNLVQADGTVTRILRAYASAKGSARNLTEVTQEVLRATVGGIDGWQTVYSRARRALAQVDRTQLIKARHTGAERDAKLPFKRRLTDDLAFNDVWVIDGHTFKAKVRHPDHGQPFAPEVTLAIDVLTRLVVGWSVSLSENTIAVGDCIRHAVSQHGVPAIVYSDNGKGETAKVFDCPLAGLFARLGSEHRTGLPGKPQGHGVIERSWRTHMIRAARQFGSYQGSDADSRTYRNTSLALAREQRALKSAAATGEVVQLSAACPSWGQFVDAVATAVQRYNTEHRHRALPKHQTGTHTGQHYTPVEAHAAWARPEDQVMLDGPALRHLFMPAVLRTAQRGEVRWLSQHYYSPELMQVDGEQVRVHYDLHDGTRVYVWTLDGRFVAEALHTKAAGSNGIPYFPTSAIEAARARRVQGMVKRREAQIDTALSELAGTLPAPNPLAGITGLPPQREAVPLVQRVDEPAAAPAVHSAQQRPVFDSAADRYEWLMQRHLAGATDWQPEDRAWMQAYASGPEYAALREYYTSRGLAWPDDPAAFKTAG